MISLAGVIFAVVFTYFFVWLFANTYKFAVKDSLENLMPDRYNRLMFSVLVFSGGWMCYWLLSQNRFIYSWDYGGYWTQSFSQMHILFKTPMLAIMRLGGSIWYSDYNSILPTLLAIPLKFFGYTFVRYALVNYMVFLVPAWLVLYATMRLKVLQSSDYSGLLLILLFTFTQFYRPMLVGYIDVACLIPASLSMLLLKDYDPLSFSREQIKRDVYISFVLLCTLMFRRYFVFYVEGYVAGLVLLSGYCAVKDSSGRPKWQLLKNAVLNIAVIGVFALIIMGVFFLPMLKRVLGTSYSKEYTAYNGPMLSKIMEILRSYGYLSFILAALGVILSLGRRTMRKYACFCAVSLIVTPLTFFYVQAMGIHHRYTIAVQLFILQSIGVIQIVSAVKSKALRRAAIVLSACVLCAGFLNCFVPAVRPVLSPVSALFSGKYDPLVRNDIPEMNRLCDYLNALTKGTDKGICILSSGALDDNTMQALRKPYEQNPVPNLYRLNAENFRHGCPAAVFEAGILVLTEPLPNKGNLREKSALTKVMGTELMSRDSVIGRHFKENGTTFVLDNDSVVHIYEKQTDFTEDDVKYVAEHMAEIDPDRKDIYLKWSLKSEGISGTFSLRWSPTVVKVFRWLMKNNIFTVEELAAAINRSPHEVSRIADE